ncbi:unnamed protein product [Enterobius vermicularis]|uniref:Dynein light chain n=1 Tax=Enterobius vermicularis TaxID=51028 RepID=A0A0N4V451_ENTVE|nr:unnamed protein product [Enterobius vermicularis]
MYQSFHRTSGAELEKNLKYQKKLFEVSVSKRVAAESSTSSSDDGAEQVMPLKRSKKLAVTASKSNINTKDGKSTNIRMKKILNGLAADVSSTDEPEGYVKDRKLRMIARRMLKVAEENEICVQVASSYLHSVVSFKKHRKQRSLNSFLHDMGMDSMEYKYAFCCKLEFVVDTGAYFIVLAMKPYKL